ncbi:hypothetical protein ACP4OV_022647 [Aristida adscensionis]
MPRAAPTTPSPPRCLQPRRAPMTARRPRCSTPVSRDAPIRSALAPSLTSPRPDDRGSTPCGRSAPARRPPRPSPSPIVPSHPAVDLATVAAPCAIN